jgi:DNA repair exonuclease SbcCD ATPase subunit
MASSEPMGHVGPDNSTEQITSESKPLTPQLDGVTKMLVTFFESAQALSQGHHFADVLHTCEQFPLVEAELSRLKQDQKEHEVAIQVMLGSFKRDHDADKAQINHLEHRVESLLREAQEKSDKLKGLEDNASQTAKRTLQLEDAAAKHAQQIQSERSKLDSLKAIKEKETKRCAVLEAELKHKSKDIDNRREMAESLRKELADLKRVAEERQKVIEQTNRFRSPLSGRSERCVDELFCRATTGRADQSSISNFDRLWEEVAELVCSSFYRNAQLNATDVSSADVSPTESQLKFRSG